MRLTTLPFPCSISRRIKAPAALAIATVSSVELLSNTYILALGNTDLKPRTTSAMECPSLKQGIITAILCRCSNNELAAPESICSGTRVSAPSFGATLMYQPSCLSLDGLHLRRKGILHLRRGSFVLKVGRPIAA